MRRKPASAEKPLFWIGASKRDLLAMPDSVVRHMGGALSVAQYGGKHPDAKPWRGLGPGVFEVVSDFASDTFRAAYVVRFRQAVYVLHCFQKKTQQTAKRDIDLARKRFKALMKEIGT